jgi:predicted CoA-binding protein
MTIAALLYREMTMGKTIAIVGASADRAKYGNKAVRAFFREGGLFIW